ncbi:L-serine ammonia-lyase [Xanthobacter dioxanivorans]|uniref:L-serine dehydratase n=1 Tax=Xanthobacter dioxanivorans TaxID=2528964 RepID=A0A974PRI7_9HYPH|nr:L-serine ammonia-lyase [Xanthobacter dioxanivorans]QRG08414.1 L-serine ammonia-lyase [Xanthobacter dioxanivorans]
MISVFDLFKIGIGPSSSHTVGPMVAAGRFLEAMPADAARVRVELFGSLAWTGPGHGTDSAICLGLLGAEPSRVDPDTVPGLVAGLRARRRLACGAAFDPAVDLMFNFETLLPVHSNGMRFRALAGDGTLLLERDFYSVGGGFVVAAEQPEETAPPPVPDPFTTAAELLAICADRRLSIADVQLANECALRARTQVEAELDGIAHAMFASIARGLEADGLLPGGLKVRRRAKGIARKLAAAEHSNMLAPHEVLDWVSAFAIAVNEENAAGGRIVTAPTNGAAGIIPAVLRYARDFCPGATAARQRVFLLTAAAIGGLIKRNASISGAEVGCQGEVGSAAAMAAAGLAAALGADPRQVENAAEIAMEHHLGMTCDPVGGLVQIPCIERNAFGAQKAIFAASLALRGDGIHHVSLDQVIETMRQTGADMQSKYKETAQGGLAVNLSAC